MKFMRSGWILKKILKNLLCTTSWLFKIEPAQVAELEDLLDEEQYLKEIEN